MGLARVALLRVLQGGYRWRTVLSISETQLLTLSINMTDRIPKYRIEAEKLRPNKPQWDAYNSRGHTVVLAGPGSGKTKTLVTKVARMLHEDVREPHGVACVTFSNECARELERRLAELGVVGRENLFIGTVHTFCLQHIVIPYARLAGFDIPEP